MIPKPPYAPAAAAALLAFALYGLTLAPTVAFWDAGDYLTTAHILGIPHPPGNPLFVLLAHAWELLLAPTGLSAAVRINLFSAAMSAGATFCWYLVAHRILSFFSTREVVRRVGALASVTVAGTAFTVWNHSNVNEKVYTVSLLTVALLSWLAFRWRDRVEAAPGGEPPLRPILLMVFLLALSVGNHLMALLAAPALALFLFRVSPRALGNWRLYPAAVALTLLGLSVHLFLPIRAGLDPIINEAAPTCESLRDAVVSVATFGRAGCENLSDALAREQYAKPPVTQRLAPLGAQLLNYLQYFDWQWARSIDGRQGYFSPGRLPFTLLFALLGILGAWEHARRDRKSFEFVLCAFATLSVALVFYMNFEYGFGQARALGLDPAAGEVRERDYFFVVSFSMWGLWIGMGLTSLWLRVTQRLAHRPRAALLASPVLGVAILPLLLNWSYATRAGDFAARDFAYNLLQSVEPYGVLFTSGDNDTLPLWFAQEVEGIRRDVTVVNTAYLNTPWYARQVRELTRACATSEEWAEHPTRIVCQRTFDPGSAPDFYQARPKPADTILPLSDAEIELATRGGVVLPEEAVFETRGVRAVFAADTFLMPSDQLALAVVKHAWAERPIHFASPTTADQLGLGDHVARHGLTYRLVPPEEGGELLPMPQDEPHSWAYGAFLDVERTRRLLWDVFRYDGIFERPVWTDDATRNIPPYYSLAHLTLARGATIQGDTREVERNLDRLALWEDVARR